MVNGNINVKKLRENAKLPVYGSEEAVNFIIENEYANVERKETSMKWYANDMKFGILY